MSADDTRPLAIGLLTPGWPANAFSNGIVTYVAAILPALTRLGHRVSLLAGRVVGDPGHDRVYDMVDFQGASRPARLLEAVVHRLSPESSRLRQLRRTLLKTARAFVAVDYPDIIEMEESFGAAVWVKRALDVPICVRLHGPWFLNGAAAGYAEDRNFRRRVRAERQGILMADGVSAPSRDLLSRVRAHYGLQLPDARVIPNAIAPVRERWTPAGCDRTRLLFVGRFDRHKGGDIVVEALGLVLKSVPGAQLSFVGTDSGFIDDAGRSWSLREFVRQRLPGAMDDGRLEFLGQQPPAAIAPLRRSAAVTIVASRYENFPYTAAEAMATGCPIVATNVGGIPEMVRDGHSGVLCRPGDAGALAASVVALLHNPERAAEFGRRAALECDRSFHPDVVARSLVDQYRDILARRRAAHG